MYTTIEADIKNGQVCGAEAAQLPAHAHVLITLLDSEEQATPRFGAKTSAKVELEPGAFDPMTEQELSDWGV